MVEQTKNATTVKLAEIRILDNVRQEEIQAIKLIFIKAGLLVESQGRELVISQYGNDNTLD